MKKKKKELNRIQNTNCGTCISLPRSQTVASESGGGHMGAGVWRGQRGEDPSAPAGRFVQRKQVCALCRETQLQAKLAWETGQPVSTEVR